MTTIPPPYQKTTRDGHTIDQLTNYALFAVERRLGYTPGSLTVVQGSYNAGGVSASAGTHDGGGVVDLTAADWERKVHALRAVGFAAWHRPLNWDGRGGHEHIHAVLIGNEKLSPSAAEQVVQYRNHQNGLASHGADNTWHPSPIPTFHMPQPKPPPPPPPPPPDETVWFYNLREGRGNKQVGVELKAILATDPAALGMVEGVGYRLPDVKGYKLIRDTSTPSRANLALYVRDDIGVKSVGWTDLKETWKAPHLKGQHPPRSILRAHLGNGQRVVVTHAPQAPTRLTDTRAARAEFTAAVVRLANRWKRPYTLLADWNGTQGDDTSAATIAKALKARAVGGRIDSGVVKGLAVGSPRYVQKVGGVQLLSDHKHALKFTLKETP